MPTDAEGFHKGRAIGIRGAYRAGDALGHATLSSYDTGGNALTVTTSYTYDDRDRLLTVVASDELVRTMSYDVGGRLLSITEAGNAKANVAYTYDDRGRVTSETSTGLTHSYSYDAIGNRISAAYGTGRTVTTSYDALNRPETIAEGGRLTRYGYDLAGRAVLLIAGNGQVSENEHDMAGRLVNRTLFRSLADRTDGGVLAEFGWSHDALGNVTAQHETWPGEPSRGGGVRTTTMTYDGANRLWSELINEPGGKQTTTTYTYDAANNRSTKTVVVTGASDPATLGQGAWSYIYNTANQLTAWTKFDSNGGTQVKSAALTYDANGNRVSQTVAGGADPGTQANNPHDLAPGITTYARDSQNRLLGVTMPDGSEHAYSYDYRTRRIETRSDGILPSAPETHTTITFSGGLSVAEWESDSHQSEIPNPQSPIVEYTRGPDMGGGVGGLLYTARSESSPGLQPVLRYNLSNGRGDIVAQSDPAAALTWTASYEAHGRRTTETGTNADKQRGNSKDEDPTGLLNEGFRYRDLETGVWLSRDPAGFVDGPNVYAYVKQNPWSKFDPRGLADKDVTAANVPITRVGHHVVPAELWDQYKFGPDAQRIFDSEDARIPTNGHNGTRHPTYTREVEAELVTFLQKEKVTDVGSLSQKRQRQIAEKFVSEIRYNTDNAFIRGFNEVVSGGPDAVREWAMKEGDHLPLRSMSESVQGLATSYKAVRSESKLLRLAKRVPLVKWLFVGGSASAGYASGKERGDSTAEAVVQGAMEAVNPLPSVLRKCEAVLTQQTGQWTMQKTTLPRGTFEDF